MKKKYLIEALSQARTKEKQLLSNLNHLEKEEENILKTRQEMNQKELLRFLYNQQNQQKSIERMKKIDQIRQIIFMEKDNNQEQDKNPPLHTTSTTTTINPILELTKKYQDLLESSQSFNEDLFDIKKIQYKENDIQVSRTISCIFD
jgi:hypothetical protein